MVNLPNPSASIELRPPRWLRLINRIGHKRRFLPDATALERSASSKAGYGNFGGATFDIQLDALVEAVNNAGQLTPFGAFAFRQYLVKNLITRLNVIEACRRFPDIVGRTLKRPVFVTGWYRTGTTLLHNLLHKATGARTPLLWELQHPCPGPDPRTARLAGFRRRTRWANRLQHLMSPNFQQAHPMASDWPDECFHLFENAACSTMAVFLAGAERFAWWLLEHDARAAYGFYALQLKLLDWLRPGARWLLKWPFHLWHMDALFATFPDAIVVRLHREAAKAVPSVCHLTELTRTPFCTAINRRALGRFWLEYCSVGAQRADRATAIGRVIDIEYRRLVENPAEVVGTIAAAAQLPLIRPPSQCTPAFGGRFRPQRYSAFDYSLSDIVTPGSALEEQATSSVTLVSTSEYPSGDSLLRKSAL